MKRFSSVDEYIGSLPEELGGLMEQMRQAIRQAAPEAGEKISYSMPAFTFHGMLVYYAAHKRHIGFYPVSSAIHAFREELAPYETSKGTVRLPLDRPLPLALIRRMVEYRVNEQLEKKNKTRR